MHTLRRQRAKGQGPAHVQLSKRRIAFRQTNSRLGSLAREIILTSFRLRLAHLPQKVAALAGLGAYVHKRPSR